MTLVVFAAALIALAVQSGELGSADTTHRLQSAHSFWTSEPPVFPNEYPEFGIHGKDGSLQSWYGIGQSLLMLPSDIVGTMIERLPVFANYNGNDPSVRNIFVSCTVNTGVNMLTALVCMRFLLLLGFSMRQRVAGTLALLALTTHLHYTQNMMENNYICLLTLTGFACYCEWTQTGGRKALLLGACAFGLNLLTRLTTGLDLIAGILFLLLVLYMRGERRAQLCARCRTFVATAVPVFAVFGLLDRLYQYHRFGSFFNTYVSIVAREARDRDPHLPATYPWTTPFHIGFFGALFSPGKSIFLFDPLLILAILVSIAGWRRFSPEVKAYTLASALLLLAYLSFYARYFAWAGGSDWGDRYAETAVELAALLAVPLLVKFRKQFSRFVIAFGAVVIAVSAVVQAGSVAFWQPLELYQMETLPRPMFVVGLRMENIVAFALGKMEAWGLNTASMREDAWDYVHITSWNFLPFVLKRGGEAPMWVVWLTLAFWLAGLAALAWVLVRLWRVLRVAEVAEG
ncbi:MAG TPA: hypothetical protein VKB38_00935 [Terracidiphilus sp.]|nr:hypothetical protein [Terracidiphilus sp.]